MMRVVARSHFDSDSVKNNWLMGSAVFYTGGSVAMNAGLFLPHAVEETTQLMQFV